MLAAIAAQDSRGCIGVNGAVPWRVPSDLKRLRGLTVGKVCLMGAPTYRSLGRPLPHRYHLIISRKGVTGLPEDFHGEVCGDLSKAVWERAPALVAAGAHPEVIVFGGADIYRQTLPVCRRLYLTTLTTFTVPGGDAYFPTMNPDEWDLVHLENTTDPTVGTVKFAIYDRQGW